MTDDRRAPAESVDLGPLEAFPEGRPVLRKDESGHRYACVRTGGAVQAIDDRCPHQGYPLSQGTVRDGVLTCEWHNWKFDLATGGCTFGGDPVRRYPTHVADGRVHLDRAVDRGAETRRLVASLREALVRDDAGRALREAIRLGALGIALDTAALGPLTVGFELLALDGAERAEYGFDHGLAVLADLVSWAERGWVGAEEAFVQAARAIAEPSKHLGRRGKARGPARASAPGEVRAALAKIAEVGPGSHAKVTEALVAERRDEAEAVVRALVESGGAEAGYVALMPFATLHIHDYGHGAIFLAKALELAQRFPAASVELMGATTAMLAWATADTSLPPFAATREALETLDRITIGDRDVVENPTAFEASVLASERDALGATLAALRDGVSPAAILRRVAHAAAVRLARFDDTWERRLDAEVNVLDVTHAVTFIEAAITLATRPSAVKLHAARLAVLAAGFLGKLRRADRADGFQAPALTGPASTASLVQAVEARDVDQARAVARSLGAAERSAAYQAIAPFAALDAAVRPIFYAHTVKTTEALRRLEAADPAADGAYLEALVAYLAPRRPEGSGRRIAAVARKFMENGRPPEGLY